MGWGGHVLPQFFREIILVTESILRTSRHTKPLVPTGNTLQCKVHVVACRALAKEVAQLHAVFVEIFGELLIISGHRARSRWV